MILKKFGNIPVELPKLSILKRMGYNRHLTGMSEQQQELVSDFMQQAFELCRPAGRYALVDIIENNGESLILDGGVVFASPSVAGLLADSSQCILLAAKLDNGLISKRDEFISQKNGAGALIYDAVGSEVVDDCLPWMLKRIAQEYSRFGRKPTTRRFSAGYGDFALSCQADFYNILQLGELGVELNENYIFTPEKTVTAIAGLE